MIASQGFVFMMVYFTLQRMGTEVNIEMESPKEESPVQTRHERKEHLTGSEIQASAKRKEENVGVESARDGIRSCYNFNIFDGTPNDENSPWAMFVITEIDEEEESQMSPT